MERLINGNVMAVKRGVLHKENRGGVKEGIIIVSEAAKVKLF